MQTKFETYDGCDPKYCLRQSSHLDGTPRRKKKKKHEGGDGAPLCVSVLEVMEDSHRFSFTFRRQIILYSF